jgi:hypothetical protein
MFYFLYFVFLKGNINTNSMWKINNFKNNMLKVELTEKKFEIWIILRQRWN